MLDIRDRIVEIGREAGVDIWAAKLREGPEDVTDMCLEEVRKARHFLCVLSGDYGGTADEKAGWGFLEGVSVLELELFQASITRKPIRLFLLTPGDIDPRLVTLLAALKKIRPDLALEPVTVPALLDAIRRLVAPSIFPRRYVPGSLLMFGEQIREALAFLRSPYLGDMHRASEDIRFLDGETAPLVSKNGVDRPAIQRLLAQAREYARSRNYPFALSRLWSALRWLYAVPYTDKQHVEYLPLWHEALVEWAALSAWQGLHGHIVLGRLAAVNTLRDVRAHANAAGAMDGLPQSIHASRGGAASEYFSLSRLMASAKARAQCLAAATKLVEGAIAASEAPESHLRAIYGSILLEVGDMKAGVVELSTVLRIREMDHAPVSEIGEARSELGYALYKRGEYKHGLELMAHGCEELAGDASRPGFLARAQEKLGLCLLRSGRVPEALRAWRKAFDIIDSMGLAGQTLDVKRRLARLVSTGRWRL